MATVSFSTNMNISTDAIFQSTMSGLHNTFLGCGLVNTADTGQMDLTTVLKPTATGNAGFKIYRLNDALQATHPIFIKVWYGCGSYGSGVAPPRLQIYFGTGTDGAGNLVNSTGMLIQQQCNWDSGVQSGISTIRASGDGSRMVFFGILSDLNTAPQTNGIFHFERTRNANGAPNGNGLITFSYSTITGRTFAISTFGAGADYSYNACGIQYPASGYGAYLGNVAVFPQRLVSTQGEQAPCLNVAGYFVADTSPLTPVSVLCYDGVYHTYLPLGGYNAANGFQTPFTGAGSTYDQTTKANETSWMMLWE